MSKISQAQGHYTDFKEYLHSNFQWVKENAQTLLPYDGTGERPLFKNLPKIKINGLREPITDAFLRLPKCDFSDGDHVQGDVFNSSTKYPNRMTALIYLEKFTENEAGLRQGISTVFHDMQKRMHPLTIAKYQKQLFEMQIGVEFLQNLRIYLRNKPVASIAAFIITGLMTIPSFVSKKTEIA